MAIDLTGISGKKVQNSGEHASARVSRDDAPASPPQAGTPNATDTVSLTDMAARLHKLEAGLASIPVVDARRVDGIRLAITNGSFEVDPQEVAVKIISFETSYEMKIKP